MAEIRERFSVETGSAQRKLKDLADRYVKLGTAADNAKDKMSSGFGKSFSGYMKSGISNINQMNTGLKTMQIGTARVASGMRSVVVQVAALAGSVVGIKKSLDLSDSLTSTTARLNAMNDGMQTTAELQKMIMESAQRARGSYAEMASVVARFGNNAREAFSNTEEVVKFAELVQKQMIIAGASTEEASNAMLQLSQALGSGVLRGDELNSIFEQAPNLIRTIANYMGQPVGKMRELAAEGKITGDIVKNAILNSAMDINAQFDAMPRTWAQSFQAFKNASLSAFQPILNGLNTIANSKAFDILQSKATALISSLASGVNYVIEGIVAITGGTTSPVSSPVNTETTTGVLENQATAQNDVAEATDQTAQATQRAAKAQKEYNASVMSFDQLHKLSGSSSSSTPGATNTQGQNTGNTGADTANIATATGSAQNALNGIKTAIASANEEAAKPNKIKQFFDDLLPLLKSGNLSGVGAYLGEKAHDLIHNFAKNFSGEGAAALLASGVNGFFSLIRNAFSSPEDWNLIGVKFGEMFNKFITDFDPENAAQAINNFVDSTISLIGGFFSTIDTKELKNDLVTFLENIDWVDVAKLAAPFVALKFSLTLAPLVASAFIKALGSNIAAGIASSGFLSGLGTFVTSLGAGAGAAGTAYGLFNVGKNAYSAITSQNSDAKSAYGRKAGKQALGMGAGAAAGAAIGSVIPVIGTGVGALIGAGVGYFAGNHFTKSETEQIEELRRRGLLYADGGFPATGQAFIARESGAELVGSISGRTAVMNNDQIVAAVSQGVAQAVSNVLVNNNSSQDIVLRIDSEDIARASNRGNRRLNIRNNPQIAFG